MKKQLRSNLKQQLSEAVVELRKVNENNAQEQSRNFYKYAMQVLSTHERMFVSLVGHG